MKLVPICKAFSTPPMQCDRHSLSLQGSSSPDGDGVSRAPRTPHTPYAPFGACPVKPCGPAPPTSPRYTPPTCLPKAAAWPGGAGR